MTTRRLLILLASLACVPLAYGKGSADRILITGGGLTQPIRITDPSSLKAFDPWGGQFADWQQQPLAGCTLRSTFFFSQVLHEVAGRESSESDGDLPMVYATRYCSTGASGYIYLPGPDKLTIATTRSRSCAAMQMENGILRLLSGIL